MDKIYSRKRIKVPKIKEMNTNNRNAKKIFSISIVFIIALLTFYGIYKFIDPIFEDLCIGRARQIATNIVNSSANKVLNNTNYSNVVTIEKNEKNKVLKTDVAVINKIAADIALESENKLKKLEKENIKIPIGALTGNKFLAAAGPNINIKIIPTGNILTQIKNEFESKGINQTVYRTYLEITCRVSIVTQYKKIEESIVNKVLLVETVIVGEVPNSYYNLEGMKQDDILEVVE